MSSHPVRLARKLAGLAITALFAGLMAATLVRLSPGWDVDEAELDARRSEANLDALRQENQRDRELLPFYIRYLKGLVRGDFGTSRAYQRPVSELLAERWTLTARMAGVGWLAAWLVGFVIAVSVTWFSFFRPGSALSALLETLAALTGGLFLCLPAAALGFLALLAGVPGEAAIAAALFPKIYRYAAEALTQALAHPHVAQALARGIARWRVLIMHVLWPAAAQWAALGAMSVSMALGVALPLEAVLDAPGIGQLAWKAALARDMPVLIAVTLLVTLAVKGSGIAASLAERARP